MRRFRHFLTSSANEKVFDFYEEILILVESKEFMLNTRNTSKISERDYIYQIWLPLLSKLYNINKNIVRIKTGETVTENTIESKANLYYNHTNIVGFKTDLRILVDFDDEEFDLVCGEGCLRDASDKKISSDTSKLAREAKEAEWIDKSITRAAEQFLYNNNLELNGYSESDLLHEYSFNPRREEKYRSIPKSSVAVFLGRNKERSLEAIDKRPRKSTGAKADILFRSGNSKLGACEVGNDNVTIADDNYIDDGLFKLPKTLKDVLATPNLSMELVVVYCPYGSHIARVCRTQRPDFPSTIQQKPAQITKHSLKQAWHA
ncbi:hypothetical protein INT47_009337 [Mucor saturninus]|uniref:Uncharacterized protein n=1 Tax=Mucor saturninus TaxID=64648 RepID=A0A8H7R5I7_9FUNG|nr:hypothetical protein INT47_009337 [Mucor saturninus]